MQFTLKQARLFAGKTQSEAANHLGLHVQTFAKIEKHPEKATISQAIALSDFYKIPCDQIFFGSILLKVDNDTLSILPKE
jgi:DNA-binding XRE family transcriptional regulator